MMTPTQLAALAFSVVMLVMVLLTVLLYAVRFVASRTAAPRTVTDAEPGIDEATMAVLIAAAHTALGSPIRIHHVHLHHDNRQERWSRAGRMDIMLSHRVGPRR